MVKQSRTRRLSYAGAALTALVVALLAGSRARVAAQTPTLRWAHNAPGDSKPLNLAADEIHTWVDGGQRVILLRGSVYVEQGVVLARTRQAVVWIDEARQKTSGIYYIDIYGDGDFSLAEGAQQITRTGPVPRALIQLGTRGQIGWKSKLQKIGENPLPRDPLYLAAVAERSGKPAAPAVVASGPLAHPPGLTSGPLVATTAPPIKQISFQEPARPLAAVGPAPLPVVPAPAPPAPVAPAFQPVQGPAPVPPPQVVPLPPAGPVAPFAPPVPPAPPNLGGVPGPAQEVAPAPRRADPGFELEEPPLRTVLIRPRAALELKARTFSTGPGGETAIVISSGAIINISDPLNKGVIDIEADQVVVWTRGNPGELFREGGPPAPHPGGKRPLEFYLAGHVEIRQQFDKDSRVLRADEIYYDVNRAVAIALQADLEIKQPSIPDPLHMQSPTIYQLNAKLFKLDKTSINASKLPYGPGLEMTLTSSSLEQLEVKKRGLLQYLGLAGPQIDRVTGQELIYKEQLFRGKNPIVWIENVPVFYFPYVQGDTKDPLGPINNLMFNYNRIFGFETFVTLNAYNLLGIVPNPGTSWRFNIDYLSARGPALGTDYMAAGKDLFGIPSKYDFRFKAYGIDDHGNDILGGNLGQQLLVNTPTGQQYINIVHPELRGWLDTYLNVQQLPNGFTFQAMGNAISDRAFLPQYFPFQWLTDLNQETTAYLKQQQNNWAWTALGEVNDRNWITETNWSPLVQGYLLGEKFFDLFTYNVHASAGYAHLQPTHQPQPPISITDQNVETGRFDVMQELSLPLALGDLRIVPYVTNDDAYYTQDLDGQSRARFYLGGGVRSSLPLSRLFPDVSSELLNIHGLYHKIVFSSNYYAAHSDTPYTLLPQLDRLNDDASDQALRNIYPYQSIYNPGYAKFLTTSPLFQPQTYAIRTLVFDRVDTLDSIQVLQGDIRQRLQTKRGYPGQEHIIDWMTLDLSASYFPNPTQDNFGQSFAFLKYDYKWHIGDRLTFLSDGWYDPHPDGPRTWMTGFAFNRPDNTSLVLTYRQIDPLLVRMVQASFNYQFSPKYSMTFTSNYDFGNNLQTNSFMLTRTGSDVQVSLGLMYNSIVNTYSFTFALFPTLLPANKRAPGALSTMMQNAQAPR